MMYADTPADAVAVRCGRCVHALGARAPMMGQVVDQLTIGGDQRGMVNGWGRRMDRDWVVSTWTRPPGRLRETATGRGDVRPYGTHSDLDGKRAHQFACRRCRNRPRVKTTRLIALAEDALARGERSIYV